MSAPAWTLEDAIELARIVESVCPAFGCHVALTGGLLYKDPPRKDCDLLFYRIRQNSMNLGGLRSALQEIGLDLVAEGGPVEPWCVKATFQGKPVDLLFPELGDEGDYDDAIESQQKFACAVAEAEATP